MPDTIKDFDTVLVPMQLEAFVLNPAVCGSGAEGDDTTRIAPITQPNYTFLRLDKYMLQKDVQNHADLHNTAPAIVNPRLYDLGSRDDEGQPKALRHRHGVYIHWILPRFYRSGTSAGSTVSKQRRREERLRRGLHAAPGDVEEDGSNDTPDFVQPPTRWIVIRKIEVDSIQPADAKLAFQDKEYEAWVVDSDHIWSLDQIPLDMDLQTDFAPFVKGHAGSDINIGEQAEVFIGRKTPLADWSETPNPSVDPPNLSLLQSGNQLFADFQMHNTNVFSVLDNFEYGAGDKDGPKYLSYAKASYYVLGWHWKDDVDPLWTSGKTIAHGASLANLFMTLQGADPTDSWMEKISQLHLMCHGAMYDVTWDHENKPKDVPADRYNARLRDQELAAVSVGTTPMDAIISYCTARKDHPGIPGDIAKLEESILAIDSLLYARDDGVEDQRQAKDTIYNWSFTRSPGGERYYFSGNDNDGKSDNQPMVPEREAILALRDLNQTKKLLDACRFAMTQYRWDMFSLWWKFVSDAGNDGTDPTAPSFLQKAKDLSEHISRLKDRMDELQHKIDLMLDPPIAIHGTNFLATAKPASMPAYCRANNPTVLIGGIESGWPTDYLNRVSVRAPYQVIPSSAALPESLNKVLTLFTKLPPLLKPHAIDLATEFYALRPGGGDSGTAPETRFYPQFHDKAIDPETQIERWRDQWSERQPWFPLFVEWEIEYDHIPFEYWNLDEHTARLSANVLSRYGITVKPRDGKEALPLWDDLKISQGDKGPDTRILSGRSLILPQPSFSLEAKVVQLFDNTPKDILDKYLTEDDRNDLRANMRKLSYLSSPLSGLFDGLVTQAEGSHVKPENKFVGPEGEISEAMVEAVIETAGLTKTNLEMIMGNSALTPYAAQQDFATDKWNPFKPVTHGQFRFRKLNVIDKFGQALMAIDQKPRVDGPPPIYPCISDFYEPQTIEVDGKLYANTVIKDEAKQCEFLQLPPQINQNARLNADFVKRIADDPPDMREGLDESANGATWRPATEWENPIWGWVITNYADFGIQLFLPDGTFYREVRFGGPLGALDAPKWLPFAPSTDPPTPETRQLDALAKELNDPSYLEGFWYMITTAQSKLAAAPTSYASFLNAIVGKPLALVNMGWSLELESQPLQTQTTKSPLTAPERLLTKPDDDDDESPYYKFQIRFGDREAEYDGLVGYFDTTTPESDELNLSKVKTFFAPEEGEKKPLERLNTTNYPLFTPFWEAPFPTRAPYDNENLIVKPAAFDDRRNARMSVFGAIIDPFTPVQAYSSFLPPVSLTLPHWSWQSAMNTMTAFFHAGPLTIPLNDVPEYHEKELLTSKNARDMPLRNLPLPSLGPGDWSFFQPYAQPSEEEDPQPKFNPFGIEKTGNLTKPGLQKGPYTAIEGFLQLRNPIMMPKPKQTA
ncbi:hypothetical protein Trihar35433_9274 [Trichoderma harzianum]|nr:hypothetical protein Trihar35433_9274 [Trichoderma harzianum]